MYRGIVERKLRAVFAGLNEGRPEAVTDELAPTATHWFLGRHALGGRRSSPELIRAWYARLLRIMPGIQFDLRLIRVEGPPWRTLATVEWTERNWGTDGVETSADGVNIIEIAWGKVTRVAIYTDTKLLTATLDRLAPQGVDEAHAAPIEDAPPRLSRPD